MLQWDNVTSDQLLWLIVAAVIVVLIVAIATSLWRRKTFGRKAHHEIDPKQEGEWSTTGRIDFVNAQSDGGFILQVEDTRTVDSIGGIEHREIRWRKATLDEAKTVLVAYHAHVVLHRRRILS